MLNNQPTTQVTEQLKTIYSAQDKVDNEFDALFRILLALESTGTSIASNNTDKETLEGLGYAVESFSQQIGQIVRRTQSLTDDAFGIAFEAHEEQKTPDGPSTLWQEGGLIDKCKSLSDADVLSLVEQAEKLAADKGDSTNEDEELPPLIRNTIDSLGTQIALRTRKNAVEEFTQHAKERLPNHGQHDTIEWLKRWSGGADPIMFTRSRVAGISACAKLLKEALGEFETDLQESDLNYGKKIKKQLPEPA